METTAGAAAAGAPKKLIQNEYDDQGRRIRRTTSTWDSKALVYAVNEDIGFVYDGFKPICELDLLAASKLTTPAPVLVRAYMWGKDLSGTLDGAAGVGGLVYCQPSGQKVQFALSDSMGNVTGLVDSDTAKLSAVYEYSPFGEVVRASGAQAKRNPIRFSTKLQDPDSDFYYYGYRFLNPATGRWINRDPAGEAGGSNRYQFVGNNSLKNIDLLGLVLVGIDGTGSKTWIGELGFNSHVKNFVADYAGPGKSLYLDGPNTVGIGLKYAVLQGYSFVCSALRQNRDEKVYLVGHSRGGAAAIAIADLLKKGCPCRYGRTVKPGEGSRIDGPINVQFMGLFDPVSMSFNYPSESIPDNVLTVADGVRHLVIGSRPTWGNTGSTGGRVRLDALFLGTHSALGGDPINGDVVNKFGGIAQEKRASRAIDLFIRWSATAQGANLTGGLIRGFTE